MTARTSLSITRVLDPVEWFYYSYYYYYYYYHEFEKRFFFKGNNVCSFQIKCYMVQLSGRCIACVDKFHLEGTSPVKDGYLTISLCNSVARTLSRLLLLLLLLLLPPPLPPPPAAPHLKLGGVGEGMSHGQVMLS